MYSRHEEANVGFNSLVEWILLEVGEHGITRGDSDEKLWFKHLPDIGVFTRLSDGFDVIEDDWSSRSTSNFFIFLGVTERISGRRSDWCFFGVTFIGDNDGDGARWPWAECLLRGSKSRYRMGWEMDQDNRLSVIKVHHISHHCIKVCDRGKIWGKICYHGEFPVSCMVQICLFLWKWVVHIDVTDSLLCMIVSCIPMLDLTVVGVYVVDNCKLKRECDLTWQEKTRKWNVV
jgi:hypothetical protein